MSGSDDPASTTDVGDSAHSASFEEHVLAHIFKMLKGNGAELLALALFFGLVEVDQFSLFGQLVALIPEQGRWAVWLVDDIFWMYPLASLAFGLLTPRVRSAFPTVQPAVAEKVYPTLRPLAAVWGTLALGLIMARGIPLL